MLVVIFQHRCRPLWLPVVDLEVIKVIEHNSVRLFLCHHTLWPTEQTIECAIKLLILP